jgi:hypothetical protein
VAALERRGLVSVIVKYGCLRCAEIAPAGLQAVRS